MDALLMTAALIGLMIGALVLLGRTWPRSSRLGGYRAGRGAGHEAGAATRARTPASPRTTMRTGAGPTGTREGMSQP